MITSVSKEWASGRENLTVACEKQRARPAGESAV